MELNQKTPKHEFTRNLWDLFWFSKTIEQSLVVLLAGGCIFSRSCETHDSSLKRPIYFIYLHSMVYTPGRYFIGLTGSVAAEMNNYSQGKRNKTYLCKM